MPRKELGNGLFMRYEIGDSMRLLEELIPATVDHCFMDPPYNINVSSQRGRHKSGIANDNMTKYRFIAWFMPYLEEIDIALKDDAYIFIFGHWKTQDMFRKMGNEYWQLRDIFVCVKEQFGLGWHSRSDYESLLMFTKGKPPLPEPALPNVLTWENEQFLEHINQKPVKLIEEVLSSYTKPGQVILDPFAGSGSTGRACRNLKRSFILGELEEKYDPVIRKRIGWDVLNFEPMGKVIQATLEV